MSSPTPASISPNGAILAPARLDRWLVLVLAALVVTCTARYLERHGLDDRGPVVIAGGVLLLLVQATAAGVVRRAQPWRLVTVAATVIIWAILTWAAPSFAWCAVPVAFQVLAALPFGWAVTVVLAMTVEVSAAWLRVTHTTDPTLVVGPVALALVTVLAYRALERESRARARALEELSAALVDLAVEQRRSGALAERTRISRDIHDSVGQGLSSINLLLQAAEQSWQRDLPRSRAYVATAAQAAREGLDEVRRVVADLAPTPAPPVLLAAMQQVGDVVMAGSGPVVEVHVHGEVDDVAPIVVQALIDSARGALANVREHAAATRVGVTITRESSDQVVMDVRDDGVGFEPTMVGSQTGLQTGLQIGPRAGRGRGVAGLAERAKALGGSIAVESALGEGTTVSVRLPVRPTNQREQR